MKLTDNTLTATTRSQPIDDSLTILLRQPEVLRRTGLCRSSLYAAIKQQKFPAQVKLSERSSAWVEREVQDWIDSRIRIARDTF